MVLAKKIVYVQPFEGMPTHDNFKLVEEELPQLRDGEFLAEAIFLSVDPYQRAYSTRMKNGDTMFGTQIAKIIETKSREFPVGKYIIGGFGWRTHTVSDPSAPTDELTPIPTVLPYDGSFPLSLFLGILGMPGNTAYFGFLDICKPKLEETVVISGAAGAVGSHVGQIAKIKGCRAIGIAGTDEKCRWLESIGFDYAINYKKGDLAQELKMAAPDGVDCYFDNVGGEISSTVIYQMNRFGRISACGSVSSYNDFGGTLPKATLVQPSMVLNELEMKGFIVMRYMNRWLEGINQNMQWLKEGKLKYKETITEGFENVIDALIGVLQGDNIGKAIVKV